MNLSYVTGLIVLWINCFRDFYFRAPGSLALLTFTHLLNFSSLFPSLFPETLAFAPTVGFRLFQALNVTY